jgi:hypothetical protein
MGNDSPQPSLDPSLLRGVFSVAKDLLPYLMMLYSMIFGFGVKQSTSDRNQELLTQDHVQLQELRGELATIKEQQARTDSKLDVLLKLSFRGADAK